MLSMAKERALDDLVEFISKRLGTLEHHNIRYVSFVEDFEILIDDLIIENDDDRIIRGILLDIIQEMNELIEDNEAMIHYLKGILKLSENRKDDVYERVLNGCKLIRDLYGDLIVRATKIKIFFNKLYSITDEYEDVKEEHISLEHYIITFARKTCNEVGLYIEKMMMIQRRLG